MRALASRPTAVGAGLFLSVALALAGCGGSTAATSTAPAATPTTTFAIHDSAFSDANATGCISILKDHRRLRHEARRRAASRQLRPG